MVCSSVGRIPRLWRAAGVLLSLWLCMSAGVQPGVCEEHGESDADGEQTRQRLKQEAIVLYRNLLGSELSEAGRCGISSKWEPAYVHESSAKEYFNIDIHATLGPPDSGTLPAEVLDTERKFLHVFCNSEERISDTRQRFEIFKTAKIDGLQITVRAYSFPIFNRDYTRAAVKLTFNHYRWLNPNENGGWDGNDFTAVYEKRNGVWGIIADLGSNSWDGSAGIP
jgi:hypothetical protein